MFSTESQEQNSAVLPASALDTDEAYLAVAEKYDMHRILMPDGSMFEFQKNDTSVRPNGATPINDAHAEHGTLASMNSIDDKQTKSQEEISDKKQSAQQEESYSTKSILTQLNADTVSQLDADGKKLLQSYQRMAKRADYYRNQIDQLCAEKNAKIAQIRQEKNAQIDRVRTQ